MHEASLIADLIAKVEQAARDHGAHRVITVAISVGALDPAAPEHLRGHFEAAAAGTMLEGAELRITRNPDPLTSGLLLESVELER